MKTNFLKHLTALVFLFCVAVSARATVTYSLEADNLLRIRGNATDDDLTQEYVANTIIPNATYRSIYKIVIEGIRKIEDDAFSSFWADDYNSRRKAFVTHITLNNVGEVGSNSFSYFTGLEQLVIQGTTTCNLKYDSFSDSRIKNINVECPITTTIKNEKSSRDKWRGAFSDLNTIDCIKFDCPTVPLALCFNTEIKNVVFTATVKNVSDVFGKELGDFLVRPSFETVIFEEASESIGLADFDCHSVQNFAIARPFKGLDDSLETGTFTIGGNFKFNDVSFSTGYNLLPNIQNLIINNPSLVNNANGFTDKINFANKFPKLEHLTIGNIVTEIGDYAFYGCKHLKTVDIQNENITIGENAFPIKEDMTYDEWVAFYHSNCTVLYIPNDAIANKGDYTANQNLNTLYPNVKKVVFGPNVTTIGDYIFRGENNIETVEFNSLVTVGEYAFGLNKKLRNLTADKITNCSEFCFFGCSSLTSLDLANCKTIAKGAFASCPALTEVKVYNALESVSESAFSYDSDLKKLYINSKSLAAKNYDEQTSLPNIFRYIEELTFGPDVTSLGESIFDACKSHPSGYIYPLQKVTFLSDQPIAVGALAFNTCRQLNTIVGKIKSVAAGSFAYTDLSQIRIYNDTEIEESAFEGCSNLADVDLPVNLETIGKNAFSGCTKLNRVNMIRVVSIGENAFKDCSGLEGFELPEVLTTLDQTAFTGCSGLKYLTIQGQTIANAGWTKENNLNTLLPSLTSVTFGPNVSAIHADIFNGHNNLTNVYFLSNVKVGDHAFQYNDNLFSINCEKITECGTSSFRGCSKLHTLNLTNCTKIGDSAFSGCTGLTEVHVDEPLTSIYPTAFYNCSNLKTLYINSPKLLEMSIEESNPRTLTAAFSNNLESVFIGNNVKVIGARLFSGSTTIKNLNIGTGVTEIDKTAFVDCTALKNLVINSGEFASVDRYSDNLFDRFPRLETLTFGPKVEAVGDNIFFVASDKSSALKKINFNSTPTIGAAAFSNNKSLTTIIGTLGSLGRQAFVDCSALTSISIAKGPIDIFAFMNCSALESVTLPEDLKEIKSGVFYGCSALTEVVIPDGVTSIGNAAFSGCSSLAKVEIPASVMTIGNTAFSGCSSLEEVVIPDGVKSIEQSTFNGCTSLAKVEIPAGVTSIGTSAFKGCTSLAEVEIPAEVTSIEESTFEGCSSLAEVEIPAMVTSIGKYAFKDCTALAKVEIPAGVTSIGNYAFRKCATLNKVVCHVEEPITINGSMFQDTPYKQLQVPSKSVSAYKTANYWKNFSDIVPIGIVELVDGQPYTNDEDQEVPMVRYTRKFSDNVKGNWQALYVPFAIDVEAYKDQFDFAEIFTICPIKDTNKDEVIDSRDDLYVVVSKLTSGSTTPNLPYLIRSKDSGTFNIEAHGVILAAAQENEITFSTTRTLYTIHGLYEPVTLTPHDNRYYVASQGTMSYRESSDMPLNANRWYMHANHHDYGSSSDEMATLSPMRIISLGEETNEANVIRAISGDKSTEYIYTLNGTRVSNSNNLPAGMYIKNGKKIMIR